MSTKLFTRTSAFAIGAALLIVCHDAIADWKPSKTVEIVIASSPGAGTDRTGRWIKKHLLKTRSDRGFLPGREKPAGT